MDMGDEPWKSTRCPPQETGGRFGGCMPLYDFRCLACKRRFEVRLTYAEYGAAAVTCPHCQSSNVTRKIGRVRFARSDESRLEDMAAPDSLDGLDQDPRALGKMMKQMSSQMGEDMGPEFHEVVNRLEKGQSPEDIEREMPDLGGSEPDGGFGSGDMDFD